MEMGILVVLALLSAIAATVLCFIFIVPEKRRAGMNKFGKFLHDLVNFKFLIIEKILQFVYILATAFTLTMGFFMLFYVEESYGYYYSSTEWYGGYGLLTIILGPIAVRLVYEILMMAILLIKNVIQINNKIESKSEVGSDPFAVPVAEYKPEAAPVYVPECEPVAVPVAAPVINPEAPVAPVAAPADGKIICPTCGKELSATDSFCVYCGQKL
ncbi:MAG: zinc ribbon domain-containing protein [Clostridia bacterium]|nr:zinc ribbon domain-containing protein [Clostridia bacterium]